ncbi:MAG: serine hydrolase domain-containing protein, partial [Ktedonobacterales bacterium]
PGAGNDAARVTGFYASSRHTALRIFNALAQSAVTSAPHGEIATSALTQWSGVPKRWREVGPLSWSEVNGQAHVEFVTDEAGNVQYWVSDDTIPVEINQRVRGLGQSSLLRLLGGLFVVVMLLAVAIWVGGAIIRRRFLRPLELSRLGVSLRLASRIGAAIYLVLLVGWLAFFASLTGLDAVVSGQLDGWFMPLYILGVLAIVGSLAMIGNAGLRARIGPGGALARW